MSGVFVMLVKLSVSTAGLRPVPLNRRVNDEFFYYQDTNRQRLINSSATSPLQR